MPPGNKPPMLAAILKNFTLQTKLSTILQMNIRVLNKIFGALVILANLIIYIPWTWEIIKTNGGGEGWGLLFLPLTIGFHLFVLTGIFGWLRFESKNSKFVKTTLIAILFLLGFLSLINIGWVTITFLALITIGFFSFAVLTIQKKLTVERTILIVNIIGISLMATVKFLLNI
jgi:hypothetical protein